MNTDNQEADIYHQPRDTYQDAIDLAVSNILKTRFSLKVLLNREPGGKGRLRLHRYTRRILANLVKECDIVLEDLIDEI